MAAERNYTSWAVIGGGEAGGRIASQFLVRTENPGIDDRIVIINTNDTDIRGTLDRVESRLATIDRETVNQRHVAIFGSRSGVGNDFIDGEACAKEGFAEILQPLDTTIAGSDAVLYSVGLGGGTGNGAVPYIIEQLARGTDDLDTGGVGETPWTEGLTQFALGAWPYEDDQAQQHFNAICGLSRLIKRNDGSPNADLTLLVSNSHLETAAEEGTASDDGARGGSAPNRNDAVNEQIIPAIDILISAGRHSEKIIDVNDYVRPQQNIGCYHATFGVALDKPPGLKMEALIEKAASNTFVPMDVGSSVAAYLIVRAPERTIEQGRVTSAEVDKAFSSWLEDKGIQGVGLSTLSRKSGADGMMDVMVLLGGFDLDPLLDQSREKFERFKQLSKNGLYADAGKQQRIRTIERNLEEYQQNLSW